MSGGFVHVMLVYPGTFAPAAAAPPPHGSSAWLMALSSPQTGVLLAFAVSAGMCLYSFVTVMASDPGTV
jgi:hypothetical protein